MTAWKWARFVLIWVIAALLWTLAAVRMGMPPLEAVNFGGGQMAVAGLLTLGIWRLSARVPWRPRSWPFVLIHVGAMGVFAAAFTAGQGFGFAGGGPLLRGIQEALTAPVAGWNLLMGGVLYLAIAGVSYARRVEASLRESERVQAEARVSAREAQLAALHAQLHPHFLFNALNTVSALVHADAQRADRALDDLGKLLRYELRVPSDDVTLRQEWEFARDYLAFEELRLGSRLRLQLDIDEAALSARVPPFVLQPLIENAVRHGVAGAPEGGAVAVRIAGVDGTIVMTIRNAVPAAAAPGGGMAGSGLQRLRERLDLTYGMGRAEVEARAEGAEFVVTVVVPARGEGLA